MLNVFHMWSSALILFYILRFVAFAVSIRHINKTVWNVKDQRVIKTLRARNYTSHRREHSTPTEGLKWKILVGCLWDDAGRCKVCFTSSSQTSQPTANYSLTAANKCKWLKVKARNFLPHHFVQSMSPRNICFSPTCCSRKYVFLLTVSRQQFYWQSLLSLIAQDHCVPRGAGEPGLALVV